MSKGQGISGTCSNTMYIRFDRKHCLAIFIELSTYPYRLFIQSGNGKFGICKRCGSLCLCSLSFQIPLLNFDTAPEDLFFDRRSIINRNGFFRTGTGDLLHENSFVWKIADRGFGFLNGYCTQWEADGLSITGIEKFVPRYQIIFCKMDFSRCICFQYPGANRFLSICPRIGSRLFCIEFYCKFRIGKRAGSLCRILLGVSI